MNSGVHWPNVYSLRGHENTGFVPANVSIFVCRVRLDTPRCIWMLTPCPQPATGRSPPATGVSITGDECATEWIKAKTRDIWLAADIR